MLALLRILPRGCKTYAPSQRRAACRGVRPRPAHGGKMESRAKLFGHAIHPMLIVFPLGLLSTAAIFDVIYLLTDNSAWATSSFYLILAGIIGGLAAALFGAIDYFAIPGGTRAKRIGVAHG